MTEVCKAAIDLIKEFEGCYLNAYLCPDGVPTIGYGHTEGVKIGDRITKEEDDDLLEKDVAIFATGVKRCVKANINENQFGALVSFSFNVGLESLKHSTLLRRLNEGNFYAAANEFLKWNKAAGRVLPGLARRRLAEKELFLHA